MMPSSSGRSPRLFEANYRVYGVRKMWHALKRSGWSVGREQVARLMRTAGICGVRRGRTPITTRKGRQADTRPDLVNASSRLIGPTTCGSPT